MHLLYLYSLNTCICFQYKLTCAKCTEIFSEQKMFTHKYGCKNSEFNDISFLLSKENMNNVLTREIEFLIAVLEKDLAQENDKLRDAKVFCLEKGVHTIILHAGIYVYN